MKKIDNIINTNFKSEKERLFTNMIYTSHMIENIFTDHLKPFGISNQQFNVLRILKGAGDWVTMNRIKELMIDKAPNATRLSDKLLEKGFLERQRSEEDRRVVYLRITSKGADLLTEIADQPFDDIPNMMARISEEEAKLASEIIDALRG